MPRDRIGKPRTFLNNVSLGIYGDAVRSPAYRETKVRTLVETAAEVVRPSAEGPALCLVDDLGREHRRPVRPAALRVRISSRHPGASPSARLRRSRR